MPQKRNSQTDNEPQSGPDKTPDSSDESKSTGGDSNSGTPEQSEGVQLKQEYPQSRRLIFKRASLWILIYVLALLGVVVAGFRIEEVPPTAGTSALQLFANIFFYVLFCGLIVCAAKFIYEEFYFSSYDYCIGNERIVVKKGLLFKRRDSLPLSLVTDVFAKRSKSDVIFGLHNVGVTTVMPESTTTVMIEGLSGKNAVLLQDRITELVEYARAAAANLPPEVSNHDELPSEPSLKDKKQEAVKEDSQAIDGESKKESSKSEA